MKIEALLFDLDGTIANTLPLCIKMYQQTLEKKTGRAYTVEEITAHFGLTEAGIFQRMVPDKWEESLDYYHEQYEKHHDECGEPFAGIDKALQLLKSKGVKMAIITGKGRYTAELTARYLHIDTYFDRIEAGKEDAIIKAVAIRTILQDWNFEPQHAAYIGDTDTDMQEAAAAEVLPLAAAWADTATIQRLVGLKPYATFTTVDSFIDWIEEQVDTLTPAM